MEKQRRKPVREKKDQNSKHEQSGGSLNTEYGKICVNEPNSSIRTF